MKIFTFYRWQRTARQHFILRVIITAFLLFSFSWRADAQLSGTYTVCGSGCNYGTIQKAADDLKSQGISNSVVISIMPGVYNEEVIIGAISGVSSSKTVTFKGAGSKNTDVRVYSTIGTALTIKDADRVAVENIHCETKYYYTGSYGVNILTSKNITIQNCRVTASTSGTYIYGHHPLNIQGNTDVLIKNNYIRGGGYTGISDNSSGANTRLIIDGNMITRWYYYGIFLYGNRDSKCLNNTLDSCSSSSTQYAIYYENEAGSSLAKGNTIVAGGNYSIMINNPQASASWIIDSNYVLGGYYGIYFYGTYTSNKVLITRNRIRNQINYGSIVQSYGDAEISNNMIDMPSSGSYGLYLYLYVNTASLKVMHNTIYTTSAAGVYVYNGASSGSITIQNNLLAGSGSGYYLNTLVSGNKIEGNNITKSSGTFASIGSTNYTTFASWKSALLSGTGYGQNEQNTPVSFVNAPSNLHLNHTNPAPFGVKTSITTDFDGDLRCTMLPTVGADETKNTSGDNYKSLSGTKFTGPSKSYIGYPTVFKNSASASSRIGYRWYVNGKKVSDSFDLSTTALTYPKACIKLETYNCANTDTFTMCITVDSPTVAPTTDFIADKTVIRQGDTVVLSDISAGYPSVWSWDITPVTGVVSGTTTNAYKYLAGNKNSPQIRVRFDVAGKYKVCLTAANVKGKGATECKTDYIEVQPAVTLQPGLQTLTGSSGYIFDNGGPAGNTKPAYYYSPLPNVLIDACADSVYLVFKSFSMLCPYEYVRIYEGKNKGGKLLTCSGNMYSGVYGPGLTGSATSLGCTQNCSPIHKNLSTGVFEYDTFRASRHMFIEMESNSPGTTPGFEAYYWIKPTKVTKPKASFTSRDSICTNGKIFYTNKTTGSEVKYFWDLDGNPTDIEDTSQNPSWPYFAPGKYKISLFVSNCGGMDTFSKIITVFNPPKPVSAFKADNTTPTTTDVVFFSPNMTMCADAYKWTITTPGPGKANFVNGTKNTDANPQVTFTDTGCYDVQLYTANVSGNDLVKLTCYIQVRKPYCTPTTTNKATDLGISNVKFNTINNTSSQGTTSYTSYVNDPSKSTLIQKGETHDLTVSRSTNKNSISRTAWIDWNIDGVFDMTTEAVGSEIGSMKLSWTTTVKIPKSARNGATVLRVAVNQGSQTNDPCGPNIFGEYEDYRIYVSDDVTKPVVTLNGKDSEFVEQCETYIEPGATAIDNVDGNITSRILTVTNPAFNNQLPGTYVRTYTVYDNAGNKGAVNRIITVKPDKTPPVITIYGPDTAYYEVFNFTQLDSVKAYDCGGTNPLQIKITNPLNPNLIGEYVVTYSATDQAGNTATKKQVIIIEDNTGPTITLKGNGIVTLEVGSAYTDLAVNVSDNYYSEADLRAVLIMQSNVDPLVLGTYTVTYILTDPSGNGPVTVSRTVIVVDTQAPVLTMLGANPLYLDVNTQFADPGIKIRDNYDLNLTKWGTSGTFYTTFPNGFANKIGTYTVQYIVTDMSGNSSTLTRTVIVRDIIAPTVTLLGEPTVTLCRWQDYNDAGVEAKDNFDPVSNLTIKPEGSFLAFGTQKPGLFNLRYKVTDKAGNVGYSPYRGILVEEANSINCVTGLAGEGSLEKRITIYPNPTSGKVTIRLNTPVAEAVEITVTNSLGQKLAGIDNTMLNAGSFEIDLSTQPGGVYLVNVRTANKTVTRKVILSK